MMLPSGARAERTAGGRSRRWYLVVAAGLLLITGVSVNQVIADRAAYDLDHAINGFIRIHISDPSVYHHTALPDGRQDVSFLLGGPESLVCHYGTDAAGIATTPVTCAKP